MDNIEFEKNTWGLINNYLNNNKNYLTKHHLDSFNDFIQNKIPQTFEQYNPQILYKELDKKTSKYKYEMHIYYGGKDSKSIYISKPVIYKENNEGVVKKQMYPNEARLRNLSYSSNIFCDIYIEYKILDDKNNVKTSNKTFNNINMGKIPIMLQSNICVLNNSTPEMKRQMGECPYDQGGYFIIDGQERVIVSHERKAENKLYIVESKDDIYSYSAQIKSVPDNTFKYARTTVVNINRSDDTITVRLPMMNKQIPLFILFRLLDIESDKDILKYILYDINNEKSKLFLEHLRPSLESNGDIYDKISAMKYLMNFNFGGTFSHLLDIISTDLFPHVGDSYTNKAYYLGYVVHKLLEVKLGLRTQTDRDSFMFKRVDLSGFLLANLFRERFRQLQRDIKITVDSEYRFNGSEYQNEKFSNIINPKNINTIFNYKVIEDGFLKSFKLGNILNKKGLIQLFNRLSSIGAVSHLRRINTLGDMIMMGQRKLHSSQYGIICPVETPDGGNIGIKKHMSILCHITFGINPEPIVKLCYELEVLPLDNILPNFVINTTKVFVNGKWIGIHYDPNKLVTLLRLYRRNGLINTFISISFIIEDLEIQIFTDGGRCCRPLYIVNNNQLMINSMHFSKIKDNQLQWDRLLSGFKEKKTKFNYYNQDVLCPSKENFKPEKLEEDLIKYSGLVEFLDVDEANTTLVAMTYNILNTKDYNSYTHMEIHPSIIMGFVGYHIPYANRSQAPRNVYGTGQSKQSVGCYISNYRKRFDTSAHVLHHPQKPLIKTRIANYSMAEHLPTGINAIVAIMSYTGYNQEDSIMINKSAIEKGLFKSSYFKSYDTYETYDSKTNTEFIINNVTTNEDDIKTNKKYNYTKLNDKGIVNEGVYVEDNDVLIGRYVKSSDGNYDDSVAVKEGGYGVVDKTFLDYSNTHNHRMCKVRICTLRDPVLGDKFASRHGQKGVIGMIVPQEDMPFNKDGLTPDIIINPHAIPSRMTIGQFIESILGKVCCMYGFNADATPFSNIDSNEIFDILQNKCGMDKYGDEILYNGIYGTQIKTKIFFGPTYYQRLKHMVKDKVNSRSTGKYTLKTKQPPSGRAVGGGLRIGEMERDAILSHGVSMFLKESMVERSDAYSYYISDKSGMTAIFNSEENRFICPSSDGPLKFINTEYELDDIKLEMQNSKQSNIHKIYIPYCMKQLIQECEAMGIALRLITEDTVTRADLDLSKKEYKKIKNKYSKKHTKIDINLDEFNVVIEKQKEPPKENIPKKETDLFEKNIGLNIPLSEMKELINYLKNMKYSDLDKLIESMNWKTLYVKKMDENKFVLNIDDEETRFVPFTELSKIKYLETIHDLDNANINDIYDIDKIIMDKKKSTNRYDNQEDQDTFEEKPIDLYENLTDPPDSPDYSIKTHLDLTDIVYKDKQYFIDKNKNTQFPPVHDYNTKEVIGIYIYSEQNSPTGKELYNIVVTPNNINSLNNTTHELYKYNKYYEDAYKELVYLKLIEEGPHTPPIEDSKNTLHELTDMKISSQDSPKSENIFTFDIPNESVKDDTSFTPEDIGLQEVKIEDIK